jgi:hypothetical protein
MPDLARQSDRLIGALEAVPRFAYHPKHSARFGERSDHRVEDSDKTGGLILSRAEPNADVSMVLRYRELAHVMFSDG